MTEDKELRLLLFFMAGLTVFLLAVIFFKLAVKDPTGFTEVYLENNGETATINKPFNVQFTIHSHETMARQYDFTLTGQETVSGSITLEPNEKLTLRKELVFFEEKENQRVFIEVESEDDNFTLWFWVNVK